MKMGLIVPGYLCPLVMLYSFWLRLRKSIGHTKEKFLIRTICTKEVPENLQISLGDPHIRRAIIVYKGRNSIFEY